MRCPLVCTAAAALLIAAGPALAQSDPAGFAHVINLPDDQTFLDGGVGSHTQVNVMPGGQLDSDFRAGAEGVAGENIEINVLGGLVGPNLLAYSGSTVNINGGLVEILLRAHSGSVVNLRGGVLGHESHAYAGSVVNVTGGTLGWQFKANADSLVRISGGVVEQYLTAYSGSRYEISGGVIGPDVSFQGGSHVISGGEFQGPVRAYYGTRVDVIGTDFMLDGAPIEGLALGETITIETRTGSLSGTLADGSSFDFSLSFDNWLTGGFGDHTTLTVTLVPAPATTGAFALAACALGVRRRRG